MFFGQRNLAISISDLSLVRYWTPGGITSVLRNRDRINFLGMARTDDVIPFAVELRVIDLDFGQVSFGDLDAGGVDVGAELATNLQSRGGGGVSD